MKRILVTGANGQLGLSLKDLSADYQEMKFDFMSSSELDITSSENVRSAFSNAAYDYCINCAAYTAVDKAEDEPEKAFEVNAEGTKFLAEACKEFGVILIHISTDFIFDGKKLSPYSETDVPNPLNIYGKSKLKGEQYILMLLKDYFVVRTSWVYSEYGGNFLKTMLRLSSDRNEINVVNDQFGSPTYAKDLARFILFLIDTGTTAFGIYNFSSESNITWFDFANLILARKDNGIRVFPVNTSQFPTPALRPKYSVLSKGKIKESFNYTVPDWEEGVRICLQKLNELK